MTYCVGMHLDQGLVFMADTRTNAGVDNVSAFRKLYRWTSPGNRVVILAAAGNLATTQTVVSLLEEQIGDQDSSRSIMTAPSMFRVAGLVGTTLRDAIAANKPDSEGKRTAFEASFIVGGQIDGEATRIFMVYPEGNFIEAGSDTPFFQLGETKYGKPILARAYNPEMCFEDAVKLLIVSFDSTIKSNLSVGLPLDLQVYETDSLVLGPSRRFGVTDPYYRTISRGWSQAIQLAFDSLPDFTFDDS